MSGLQHLTVTVARGDETFTDSTVVVNCDRMRQASRGLSVTAELLVRTVSIGSPAICFSTIVFFLISGCMQGLLI